MDTFQQVKKYDKQEAEIYYDVLKYEPIFKTH